MRGARHVLKEIKDVLRGERGCIPKFSSGCVWIAGHLAVGPSRSGGWRWGWSAGEGEGVRVRVKVMVKFNVQARARVVMVGVRGYAYCIGIG